MAANPSDVDALADLIASRVRARIAGGASLPVVQHAADRPLREVECTDEPGPSRAAPAAVLCYAPPVERACADPGGRRRVGAGVDVGKVDVAMAGMIDHTLKADATADDVKKLCEEARKYCFASVCVNSTNGRLARAYLRRLGRHGSRRVSGFLLGRDDRDRQGLRSARGGASGAPPRSTWSSTSAP